MYSWCESAHRIMLFYRKVYCRAWIKETCSNHFISKVLPLRARYFHHSGFGFRQHMEFPCSLASRRFWRLGGLFSLLVCQTNAYLDSLWALSTAAPSLPTCPLMVPALYRSTIVNFKYEPDLLLKHQVEFDLAVYGNRAEARTSTYESNTVTSCPLSYICLC